jgi:hypothetical protein
MFSPKDDFGAAWPTTLLLSATGPDAKPLQDFLRIEGIKLDNGSYDGNLCVGMGFGCGFNIEFPAAVSNPGGIGQPDQSNRFPVPNKDTGEFDPNNAGCLQIAGMWTFFDTATCYPNDTGRGLLRFRRGPQGRRIVEHRLAAGATVAVMRQPCPKGSPAACRNFGFFEVVSHSDPVLRGSADPAQRIATVKERAMKNRSFGIARTETGSALASGVYTTVKERSPNAGHRIAFEAHWFSASFPAKESAMARITSIDGQERSNYPNWNLAEGDFIRGDSQGRVNIGWQTRRDGKSPQIMFLDITDRDFPFRLIPPMFTTGK